MGVPGDFTLGLIDYLQQTEGLHWVGNSNELNAANAADGYSRGMGGQVPGVGWLQVPCPPSAAPLGFIFLPSRNVISGDEGVGSMGADNKWPILILFLDSDDNVWRWGAKRNPGTVLWSRYTYLGL